MLVWTWPKNLSMLQTKYSSGHLTASETPFVMVMSGGDGPTMFCNFSKQKVQQPWPLYGVISKVCAGAEVGLVWTTLWSSLFNFSHNDCHFLGLQLSGTPWRLQSRSCPNLSYICLCSLQVMNTVFLERYAVSQFCLEKTFLFKCFNFDFVVPFFGKLLFWGLSSTTPFFDLVSKYTVYLLA